MRISLIIAAGGSGSRFKAVGSAKALRGSKKPATKLFYLLGGMPLLLRTLQSFQAIPEIKETIIALPKGVELEVKGWIRSQGLQGVTCVRGGKTRAESVQRALSHSSKRQSWVMIHDGARPFVKVDIVRKLAQQAKKRAWP